MIPSNGCHNLRWQSIIKGGLLWSLEGVSFRCATGVQILQYFAFKQTHILLLCWRYWILKSLSASALRRRWSFRVDALLVELKRTRLYNWIRWTVLLSFPAVVAYESNKIMENCTHLNTYCCSCIRWMINAKEVARHERPAFEVVFRVPRTSFDRSKKNLTESGHFARPTSLR